MNESEALQWLASIFNTEVSELHIESLRNELDSWDSMGTLMLMAELDEQYNITLTEEELAGLNSVKALFSILAGYGVITDVDY